MEHEQVSTAVSPNPQQSEDTQANVLWKDTHFNNLIYPELARFHALELGTPMPSPMAQPLGQLGHHVPTPSFRPATLLGQGLSDPVRIRGSPTPQALPPATVVAPTYRGPTGFSSAIKSRKAGRRHSRRGRSGRNSVDQLHVRRIPAIGHGPLRLH